MPLIRASPLALRTFRPLARTKLRHLHPLSTAHASPRARVFTTRRLAIVGVVSTLAAASAYAHTNGPIHADSERKDEALDEAKSLTQAPLSELVRTYVVYSLCSIPALVDWSPAILSTLLAVPILKQITEAVVRVTFFDQVRSSVLVHSWSIHDAWTNAHGSSLAEMRRRTPFRFWSGYARRTRARCLYTALRSTSQRRRARARPSGQTFRLRTSGS